MIFIVVVALVLFAALLWDARRQLKPADSRLRLRRTPWHMQKRWGFEGFGRGSCGEQGYDADGNYYGLRYWRLGLGPYEIRWQRPTTDADLEELRRNLHENVPRWFALITEVPKSSVAVVTRHGFAGKQTLMRCSRCWSPLWIKATYPVDPGIWVLRCHRCEQHYHGRFPEGIET